MFSDKVMAEIPQWTARKLGQWEAFKPTVGEGQGGVPIVRGIAGLQLMRHGALRSTFVLVYSTEEFYEAVVFGQLPQVHKVPLWKNRRPVRDEDWREAREDETPLFKRRIDLTDDQLDLIVGKWVNAETALTLEFVASVWRRDGKEYLRPTNGAQAA